MNGITSKHTLAKSSFALFVLGALLISLLSGCVKQYEDTFKNNPEAAAMMEEAIENLQMCLDGKIGVDRIGVELKSIADKYESKFGDDGVAEVYRLSLSIDASLLQFDAVDWKLGIKSTSSMMETIDEIKAKIEEDLYK